MNKIYMVTGIRKHKGKNKREQVYLSCASGVEAYWTNCFDLGFKTNSMDVVLKLQIPKNRMVISKEIVTYEVKTTIPVVFGN